MKNKSLVGCFILLVILVIILIALVVYKGFFVDEKQLNINNDVSTTSAEKKQEQKTQSKAEESSYNIVETDVIGNLSSESYNESVEIVDKNGDIKFFYPVINIDGVEITKLNILIQEKMDNVIDTINNSTNNNINDVGYKILLQKTKNTVIVPHIKYYRYEVMENAREIIIRQYRVCITEWATGYDYLETQFIVNKSTKIVKQESYEQPMP